MRNEMKRNEIYHNETKRNQAKRNVTERNKVKRNLSKQNETTRHIYLWHTLRGFQNEPIEEQMSIPIKKSNLIIRLSFHSSRDLVSLPCNINSITLYIHITAMYLPLVITVGGTNGLLGVWNSQFGEHCKCVCGHW
jgi:hypothetical protein